MNSIPASSPEVTSQVEQITQKLVSRHQGEEIRYTVVARKGVCRGAPPKLTSLPGGLNV